MKKLHVAWIAAFVILIVGAIAKWMSKDPIDDSGGPCAAVGFLMVMVLVVWSAIDGSMAKRRAKKAHEPAIDSPPADTADDET